MFQKKATRGITTNQWLLRVAKAKDNQHRPLLLGRFQNEAQCSEQRESDLCRQQDVFLPGRTLSKLGQDFSITNLDQV